MGKYWKETENGKILKPFFDKELITEEVRGANGERQGGFIQCLSTGKKYRWGEDWSATFTLASTNMAKHLYSQELIPKIVGSLVIVKIYLRDWLADEHDCAYGDGST